MDGEIGKLVEFFFESDWTIRYLVVGTGGWFSRRRVVISPVAVGGIDEQEHSIHVELTRDQINKSPRIGENGRLSREQEIEYYRYYGWPPYWHAGPSPAFPLSQEPLTVMPSPARAPRRDDSKSPFRLFLSTHVKSYGVQADDGEIGRVRDFIIDNQYWVIRYLEIATGVWLPGKHVLINPAWIIRINGQGEKVGVNLRREAIEKAPAYDPDKLITRDYEVELFKHYGREAYWKQKAKAIP